MPIYNLPLNGAGSSGGSTITEVLQAEGFTFYTPVVAASIGALTATYDNGAAGVGATLTNAGTQAVFALDGINPTVGQRVLIKNQADEKQNGVYTVTDVGSGSTNWILERAIDFDEPGEIIINELIKVSGGTQSATYWRVLLAPAVIGTDNIEFQLLNFFDIFLSSDANFFNFIQIWVDPNGSDITGDGSVTNPYETIMFAQSTISDAASSKMYQIMYTGDTCTIVTPVLKPWVFWTYVNNFNLNAYCIVNFTNPITLDASFSGVVAEAGLNGFNLRNAGVVADFDNSAMAAGTSTHIHFYRIRPYSQVTLTTVSGNVLELNAKYSEIQRLVMNGGYLNTQNCTIGFSTLNASSALGPIQHQSANDTYQSYFQLFGLDNQLCYTNMTGASWLSTGLPILRGTSTYISGDIGSYQFPNLLDTVSVDNSRFTIVGYNNSAKKILQQDGFSLYDDVMAASQGNLNATYNNGTAGNDATLTNAGAFAPFSLDGLSPNTFFAVEVGMRFLIKNQSTAFQNGIYVLTTLGDGISVNWVLTRADDLNYAGAVIKNTLTLVCFGDNNQNRFYRVRNNIATMGVSAIDFDVFSLFDVFTAMFLNREIRYVDPSNTQSVRDGSVLNPYTSIMEAQAAITDASITKPYTIEWMGGPATIATPSIKPWVFWKNANSFGAGNQGKISLSTPLTLDASFNGITATCGVFGFYFAGAANPSFSLDNSGFTNSNVTFLADSNTFDNGLNLISLRGSNTINFISNATTANNTINAVSMDMDSKNSVYNSGIVQDTTNGYCIGAFLNDRIAGLSSFGPSSIANTVLISSIDQVTMLTDTASSLTIDAQSYLFANMKAQDALNITGYDNTIKASMKKTGFIFYADVMGASTANLTATYANGTLGVGATLTNADTQQAFTVDDVTFVEGQRVLIKNQTSAFQNGIYVITVLGDNSTNWVLTRVDDADESAEIIEDNLVISYFGSVNSNAYFRVSSASSPVMGTSSITFALMSIYDIFTASSGSINTVKKQGFTSSGTYTPSAGMLFVLAEAAAGGGGGGGAAITGPTTAACGGAAGAGAYSSRLLTKADIGASKTVTIGAAGTAGTTAPTDGGVGGDTSLGSLLVANGGTGGFACAASAVGRGIAGAPGGDSSLGTGDFKADGAPGGGSVTVGVVTMGGSGGSSFFGGGAPGVNGQGTGNNGLNYGGGGGGGISQNAAAQAGGTGAKGVLRLTEFCS